MYTFVWIASLAFQITSLVSVMFFCFLFFVFFLISQYIQNNLGRLPMVILHNININGKREREIGIFLVLFDVQ